MRIIYDIFLKESLILFYLVLVSLPLGKCNFEERPGKVVKKIEKDKDKQLNIFNIKYLNLKKRL